MDKKHLRYLYNCDITINSNDNFILESKMSNDEIKSKNRCSDGYRLSNNWSHQCR